jgi:hypothetical protein
LFIAFFGIVMFPKPAVPVSPVTLKAIVVDEMIWLEVIVTFDICEFVMFPLIASSTVAPLSDVALTTDPAGNGIGENVGVGISEGVDEGVNVGVSVGSGVDV